MNYIAVIDTETTWTDKVMSIGIVIAQSDTLRMKAAKYYVITQEYRSGGMFSDQLFADRNLSPAICTRKEALADIAAMVEKFQVEQLFAYNARFDQSHLPELGHLQWYDIMRLAPIASTTMPFPPVQTATPPVG